MTWRILHILDHGLPLHSGYTFRTLAILRHQRALGWQTAHLTAPPPAQSLPATRPASVEPAAHAIKEEHEEHVEGWHFYRTAPLRGLWVRLPVLRQLARVLALRRRLCHVARCERPDILHAHSPALNGLAALSVGKALSIPVVYEVRAFWEDAAADHGTSPAGGIRYLLTRMLETWVMQRAHAVTVLCGGLREDVVARGIAGDKVTVVPNAADPVAQPLGPPDAERLRLAHELGLTGRIVIGFVGSFYAYEGLALLVSAMPALLAQVPLLHLLLVGGGPQLGALRTLTVELGLARHVTFTGRVPHADIDSYYAVIDILVYPRLPMRLTELVTPLKPLEAMARGSLLLASDVGGHRELLGDGVGCPLFRAGDAAALVAAVLQLLHEPARWPMLRLQARAHVERQHRWSASVARYADVYAIAVCALRGLRDHG